MAVAQQDTSPGREHGRDDARTARLRALGHTAFMPQKEARSTPDGRWLGVCASSKSDAPEEESEQVETDIAVETPNNFGTEVWTTSGTVFRNPQSSPLSPAAPLATYGLPRQHWTSD